MKRRLLTAFAAMLTASTLSSPAAAATVIKTLQLDVTGFSDGSPNASIIFSLNFDNSATIFDTLAGVTTISSNTFGPLRIGYQASTDILTLAGGNGLANPGTCSNSVGSFCTFLRNISTNTPFSNEFYNFTSDASFTITTNTPTSSITLAAVSAVPEPAIWAFMIFGFGAIGGAMRRQRKANVKVSYA